ncbi:MAG TPA: murein biosynthesis integral membrane protein MurJ [Albitalea sp.]
MNLLRTASTVSLLTLASRVTGLVRETLVAAAFGASAWADAYQVAFRIPNLLRRLFAEGAFSQAFVPILADTRTREGEVATRHLIDAVATALFWVLLATCAVGVVGAPVLVYLMAAGLAQFDGAVAMTRIMFPYIGFMSLVALSAGILNTWRHFAVPAATPVLLNLAVIAAAALLVPAFRDWGITPAYALAVGVMAGGLLQLGVQLPALARIGCLPRIGLAPRAVAASWRDAGVQRVLRQMLPALLGVSVAQLSLIINTQIATHLGVGSVTWYTWADRLMEFPTALLGVALGVVLLPQLTAAQSRNDPAAYSGMLDWGLRLVLLLALPCAAALLVFPHALIAVLYHYGQVTAVDVDKSRWALMGYGVGLIGLVAVKILAPGFYARQDIRTPVRIAIAVLALTQLMNLAFVPWLHQRFGLGHAGLALSIGLGATLNAAWLFAGLRRRGSYVPSPGWGAFALRVVAATAALALALGWAGVAFDWIALGEQRLLRMGMVAACLAGAALLYFGILWATGLKVREFVRRA